MKKSKSHYTQTDFLMDLYGIATVDEVRYAIACDDSEVVRTYRAAQLDLLSEMIESDDRD